MSDYQIGEILGTGKFGYVYKGIDKNKQDVAIKIVRTTNETEIKHIKSELIALEQLDHPNVIRLIDKDEFGNNKMGSSQSVQENVSSAKSNIEELHKEINQLESQINKEVSRLESQIDAANYANLNEICDQIGYHYVDILSSHFPVKTLENYGRVKLGLIPKPESSEMQNYKQTICKNIVAFYKKKLFLLTEIKTQIPKCIQQETEIYNNLSDKLQNEGINTEKWVDVYKKIQQFNKNIKYQYTQINNSIERIRNARTIRTPT